jgi:hypothetical protein
MSDHDMIKFIGIDEIKSAISLSFVTESINNYIIYGKYELNRTPMGCTVTRLSDDTEIKFGLMKTAILYCMLDFSANIKLSNRIHQMDNKITSLVTEIIINKSKIKKTTNLEHNGIAHAKLTENELLLEELKSELSKIENSVRRWQDQRIEQQKRKSKHF